VMQTDAEAVVKIEWNKTCLQHGDPKVTKHVLISRNGIRRQRTRGRQMVHGDKIYFI